MLDDRTKIDDDQSQSRFFDNQISKPLNLDELCAYLRAKKSTLRQYQREGMPHFFVGKEARYIPQKVLSWLEQRSAARIHPHEVTFDPHRRKLTCR